jgi:hypothetical protein
MCFPFLRTNDEKPSVVFLNLLYCLEHLAIEKTLCLLKYTEISQKTEKEKRAVVSFERLKPLFIQKNEP